MRAVMESPDVMSGLLFALSNVKVVSNGKIKLAIIRLT